MNIDKKDIQRLLRILSHDLRNPLVNMRALLHDTRISLDTVCDKSALRPTANTLQEQLPETLDMFEESINRMNVIILGINDIYHAMYDDFQCEDVDMQALFTRELRKIEYNRETVEIVVANLSEMWVDSLAMSQIVAKILHYTLHVLLDQKGRINISSEKRDGMDILIVAVTCGLAIDDLERVFDPFYTIYGQKGVANVDLAIVKALVESHAGSVSCHLNANAGTMFSFAIPGDPAPFSS